ncbi:MAG TPA: lipase family protein [Nevskia sp.]|nr:lipase family protein [Nevskia sp.]
MKGLDSKILRTSLVVLAGLIAASGCGPTRESAPAAGASDGPGSIVELKPFADIDASIRDLGGESLHVMYRSTSSSGKPSVVGGALFVPPGTPPPGGWTVLGFGHGTTGILDGCGPSTSPNLFNMAPMIAGYIKAGYAVAFTDYEGLSGPGVHVYLDNRTEGYNIIDAVRALHRARPGLVSKRWVTLGGSQGGGASWGAAEQAPVYAPELDLVAAVDIVPAADISGYAQMAEDESITQAQAAAYTALLIAQSRAHPELDMDLYRRGSVKKNWDALAQCYGPRLEERNRAVQEIKPEELKPSSHEATLRLQELLEKMAVPKRRAEAPMLVIYVGKDQYINPVWTKKAIEDACRMGTKIQVDFQPDKSHGTFDGSRALPWLQDRLAGKPLEDSCPY